MYWRGRVKKILQYLGLLLITFLKFKIEIVLVEGGYYTLLIYLLFDLESLEVRLSEI